MSGETIIRNLQAGVVAGTAFGGVMEVGYLPDMFGHIAQMPQILSLAGFEHAVVWRGVPSAIDRSGVPLGGARRLQRAGRVSGRRLRERRRAARRRQGAGSSPPRPAEELGTFLGPDDPILLMNGTDHQPPQTVAGPSGRRGQSDPERLRAWPSPRYRPTWPAPRRPISPPGKASCARGHDRTC